ncbi:hypothetical protein ACPA9J_04240 [Pseudomonas aeruginosa]
MFFLLTGYRHPPRRTPTVAANALPQRPAPDVLRLDGLAHAVGGALRPRHRRPRPSRPAPRWW